MIKKAEWAALSVVSVVVLLFTLNWAVKTTVHFQKDIIVPDLTGKPLSDALDTLSKINLGLKQEGAETNETVPVGTVLRQQPPAGMSVREGKIIRVTLSQGGESIFVPDLLGQSLRSAEIALRMNHLSLGEVRSRPSLKYEKDVVITQDPKSKTILQKNSLIHVMVSDGPPPDGVTLMPDFAGKKLEDAAAWAKDLNITVEVSEEPSLHESGIILSQSVSPDDAIQKGILVHFAISKNTGVATAGPASSKFHYEIPQGDAAKEFSFVLVDGSKSTALWNGSPEPGSKLDLPLPENLSPDAKVKILVNGFLTEERPAK